MWRLASVASQGRRPLVELCPHLTSKGLKVAVYAFACVGPSLVVRGQVALMAVNHSLRRDKLRIEAARASAYLDQTAQRFLGLTHTRKLDTLPRRAHRLGE